MVIHINKIFRNFRDFTEIPDNCMWVKGGKKLILNPYLVYLERLTGMN
jgi:hypothetical protein